MAAGQGFKTFNTGDVLSAADVNGYLMQGILVFASATARDAAITSPQEGQFAFLKDTNVTTYYTGSAWANVDTTGMTNPMTTTGDVIYSSSGSTPARLGIGTAGQVLKVNSGATAPEWGTVGGGGKVLQVISATTSSAVTHATAAYTTTGLTATITPSAATSKILVLTYQAFEASVNSVETANGIQLVRASTVIAGGVNTTDNMGYYVPGAANTQLRLNHNFSVLDDPNTTSATTYLVQARPFATANSMQIISNFSGQTSSIILLEIGA